ncbi:hypothetical protein Fmac_005467 [Flemingia macrophylla]|uniref:Uncharacterized protein n=1 Tax=Flemingia macrophylla TaxID=520843 RepID=A0ABD1N7V4_9FABA
MNVHIRMDKNCILVLFKTNLPNLYLLVMITGTLIMKSAFHGNDKIGLLLIAACSTPLKLM